MKITFILPSVGRKIKQKKYLRTWQMEPLAIAQLASLTPKGIEVEFFDDRIEEINYQTKTDLIAINVETYTAKRAYEIAEKFKFQGKKIIMGGFHATLCPDEILQHAHSVLIGEAEDLWPDVLADFKNGNFKKVYKSDHRPNLASLKPDRSIYQDKDYMKLGLVETGRGCYFHCNFCSITSFFGHTYQYRPIEDVVSEIKELNYKYYFFVDDNICADVEHAKKLFKALIPLKIKWISQVSIAVSKNDELLSLIKESGCLGVLIGFESLDKKVLQEMNKSVNSQINDYDQSIKKIYSYGLRIYATFVFGYDNQNKDMFPLTYNFIKKNKFTIVAFNHLVPFPGTPLYQKLEKAGRLLYKKWWLEPSFRFGDVAFKPAQMTAVELSNLCHYYRRKLYSWPSLLTRLLNFKLNFSSFDRFFIFWMVNILSKIDARKRKGLPLGKNIK